MNISKYFLSAFAFVAAVGGATAITPGSDFVQTANGSVLEIPTTGPVCELNRIITCTQLGQVVYDSFNGAQNQILADRKMRFPE